MGNCLRKGPATRQKHMEEEERMRKLEEQASAELERRKREEARIRDIERLAEEEKNAEILAAKVEEEKKMKEALMMEAERIRGQEEREREEQEEEGGEEEEQGSGLHEEGYSRTVTSQLTGRSSRKSTSISAESYAAVGDPIGGGYDSLDTDTVEMRTFTPFDMKNVDQTAKYVAKRCGCVLSESHNSAECRVCQGIDLSDAPLIA